MSYFEDDFQRYRSEVIEYMYNKEREILEGWCKQIGYKYPIAYTIKNYGTPTIIIYAKHPGQLIGKAGVHIDLLQKILKEEFYRDYNVKLVEVAGNFVNLNYNPDE